MVHFLVKLWTSAAAKTLIWRGRGYKNHIFAQVGFVIVLGHILGVILETFGAPKSPFDSPRAAWGAKKGGLETRSNFEARKGPKRTRQEMGGGGLLLIGNTPQGGCPGT